MAAKQRKVEHFMIRAQSTTFTRITQPSLTQFWNRPETQAPASYPEVSSFGFAEKTRMMQ